MSDNQSASRIAADILIAGMQKPSFEPYDDRLNGLTADALVKSFITIHRAVLEAQQKEQARKPD
ncbi:MAG: hypothetical protein BWK73_04765 [Thiothrix lacustris]|uniref:Uncharacterized protein n=1 Tax=Thiothrix lacustris TaxID=525917 RepID=A0A1Y1QXJ6_9GAMM|nr:MAG: hypothetical protein BWK73_04765 [Thiothrix lacustris]